MLRLNVIHANVFGLAVCAAGAFVFPTALLGGLGVADAPFAVVGIVRMAGVLALGLAAVLWATRNWLYSQHGVPTLRVLSVICAMNALMLLGQTLTVWNTYLHVVPIVFLGLLAISYGLAADRLTGKRATI